MQIDSSPYDPYAAGETITVWVDGQAYYGLDGHTIGRDDQASITVDHAQVSRRHAALRRVGQQWAIEDLGSLNGLHTASGRHTSVPLPPGRTQVWLGPPDSSPCLYFDVEGPADPGGYQPGPSSGGAAQPYPPPGAGYGQQPQQQPYGYDAPSSQRGGDPSSGRPPPPPPPGLSGGDQRARAAPPGAVGLQAPPGPMVGSGVGSGAGPPAPAPVTLNESGLASNVGRLSQVIQPASGELLIGRSTECDITIADPLVSRKHARLILHQSGGRIMDLGSDNGTFVNGNRIMDSPIAEGDLVELGKSQFVLSEGQLRQHIADGLPLQAEALTVRINGDLTLLSGVSFTLPAGSMTAVIGPSGSGKSTLLNALTGRRPADDGRVLLGGRDLYASDEGLGRRIGFVPQDDPVHETLTVRQALDAAARLRLPSDTARPEVDADVERVAAELGLAPRLDTRIRALSGGQRKRVSVGYELVGSPQALILDEPTSGLDPGLERELMQSLRHLADKGTTTIVVTHSVLSVELCDLVLVLAPGGRLAFVGPPAKVAGHFRCSDIASVFTLLGTRERAEWELEFARTTSYLKFGASAPVSHQAPAVPLPTRSFLGDFRVMLGRYLLALAGDRKRLLLLVLQAPVLGAFFSLVLVRTAFSPGPGGGSATRQYLIVLVVAMVLFGGFNSIREVVEERAVFRRERAVGVSPFGFVLSKWAVLAVVTSIQAAILHLVASLRQQGSLGEGVLLRFGHVELVLALAAVGVASVGIGLVISALAADTPKALTSLPLAIVLVLVLSGLLIPISGRAGIEQLTWLDPVQWGGSAAAVTIDIERAEGCDLDLPPGAPDRSADCDNPRWEREPSTQVVNFGVATLWSLLLLVGAGMAAHWSFSRPLER